MLDVFSSKANLNLVLEFLDTDLEAVIKDRSLIFQAADIKSWMLMTIRGLDHCHRNWVLHRVRFSRSPVLPQQNPVMLTRSWSTGYEAEQLVDCA